MGALVFTGTCLRGRKRVKVLPCPEVLSSLISPPSSLATSREIDRPRPVPPYFRLVDVSACWNGSKMIWCLSGGMPMPVSLTEKKSTMSDWFRMSWSRPQPLGATPMWSCTFPSEVNLKAFDSRLRRICWMRFESVSNATGRSGSSSTSKSSFLESAIGRNEAWTSSWMSLNRTWLTSTDIVPDSILDRSRMSLMRPSRSVPALLMVLACSTCFSVRFPSEFW